MRRKKIEAGVGFEYWHNKFGNIPAYGSPGHGAEVGVRRGRLPLLIAGLHARRVAFGCQAIAAGCWPTATMLPEERKAAMFEGR